MLLLYKMHCKTIFCLCQGPNPIANEFIPKSSTLSHSASSPNFTTINGNGYAPPHSNGPPPPIMMSGQSENHSMVAGVPPNSMMMSNTPPPHLVPASKTTSKSSFFFILYMRRSNLEITGLYVYFVVYYQMELKLRKRRVFDLQI